MTVFDIALGAFLILTIYTYLRARVATVVQPLRLEVLAKSETLLKHSDFPADKRANITFLLDNIYSSKAAWIMALLVFPISIHVALRRFFHRGTVVQNNFPHRKEYREILRLGVLCMMASSPAAFIVFFVVSTIAELLRLPATPAISRVIDTVFIPVTTGHGLSTTR